MELGNDELFNLIMNGNILIKDGWVKEDYRHRWEYDVASHLL